MIDRSNLSRFSETRLLSDQVCELKNFLVLKVAEEICRKMFNFFNNLTSKSLFKSKTWRRWAILLGESGHYGKRGGNLSEAGLNFTYESSNFSKRQYDFIQKYPFKLHICFSMSSDIIFGTCCRFHWFWINGIKTSPINTSNSSTNFVYTSPIVIISFKLSSVIISGLFLTKLIILLWLSSGKVRCGCNWFI